VLGGPHPEDLVDEPLPDLLHAPKVHEDLPDRSGPWRSRRASDLLMRRTPMSKSLTTVRVRANSWSMLDATKTSEVGLAVCVSISQRTGVPVIREEKPTARSSRRLSTVHLRPLARGRTPPCRGNCAALEIRPGGG
jgi:hypothetical protein